jgi:hypothetical protein
LEKVAIYLLFLLENLMVRIIAVNNHGGEISRITLEATVVNVFLGKYPTREIFILETGSVGEGWNSR